MKSLIGLGSCLVVVGLFAACDSVVEGGGDDGEAEGVTAVNLETGETAEYESSEEIPDGWAECDGDCPAPLPCGDIGEPSCLVRDDCAPLYDDGGGFDGCSDGGATCDAEACGPQPGMPAIECPDGSIGGSTGRCLAAADGSCGWEIRECPEPTCDDEACGPQPGMPAYPCDDGSVGGSTGRCLSNPDGSCGWEILECPEEGCAAGSCGDMPPGLPCADGSGTIGDCARGADGTCAWETRECPEETCADDECGPPLGMPAEECADGSIGGNTGRCIRYDGGQCGWEIRECPEDAG